MAGALAAAYRSGGEALSVAQVCAQPLPGDHQHELPEVAIEQQFVRAGAVVQGEVTGLQERGAAVLAHHALPLVLDADQEVILARLGDLARGAAHVLRLRFHHRHFHAGQHVALDAARKVGRRRRIAVELDVDVTDRVGPVGDALARRDGIGTQDLRHDGLLHGGL
jgi:hypothetical protein